MPLGKEIGEYSGKFTSIRIAEIDGEERVIEGNYEAEITGQMTGTVTGTITFTGTNDRGTTADKGVGYLASGESIVGQGHGVYWLTKPGVWETRAATTLSSGQTLVGEGTIQLDGLSTKGKIFELA